MPFLPDPSPLTTAQKKELTVKRLKELGHKLYSMMLDVQHAGIEFVWENPYGLTAQEVYDALGTDGEKVNNFHYAITVVLAEQSAADSITVDLRYPTKAMSADEQGNITVSNDPWTPPA